MTDKEIEQKAFEVLAHLEGIQFYDIVRILAYITANVFTSLYRYKPDANSLDFIETALKDIHNNVMQNVLYDKNKNNKPS